MSWQLLRRYPRWRPCRPAFTGSFFPSPTSGYTNIGDAAIFVAALLYGSRVGGIVESIGPLIADLIIGYPKWFVTIIAHGGEGVIAGLGRDRSLPIQVAMLFMSGVYMATIYFPVNVFIKGFPVRYYPTQGISLVKH